LSLCTMASISNLVSEGTEDVEIKTPIAIIELDLKQFLSQSLY